MTLPMASTAEELLSFDDRPERIVEMPEWGFSVVVREPDMKTFLLISKSTVGDDGKPDTAEMMARTILEGVVKPAIGVHLLEKLKEKSSAAILRLYKEISDGKKKEVLPTSPITNE